MNTERSEQLSTDLSSSSCSDNDEMHWFSSSESSVRSVSDVEDRFGLSKQLAVWATKNSITRSATNELLEILRQQGLYLPKDARTLLGTPQGVQIAEKCGGTYHYFGTECNIVNVLKQNPDFIRKDEYSISMTINIDGIPLFKSIKTRM